MKRQFLPLLAICLISCSEPGFHDNHVIAHRGAWKDTGLPQNSLASFTAAAEMDCLVSAFDLIPCLYYPGLLLLCSLTAILLPGKKQKN